jgi:hypothetical protein
VGVVCSCCGWVLLGLAVVHMQYVEEVPVRGEGVYMYATVEGRVIMVVWTMLKNSSCTLLGDGVGQVVEKDVYFKGAI